MTADHEAPSRPPLDTAALLATIDANASIARRRMEDAQAAVGALDMAKDLALRLQASDAEVQRLQRLLAAHAEQRGTST